MNLEIIKTIEKLAKVNDLKEVSRQEEDLHPLPSVQSINEIVELLRSVIFPGYFGKADINRENVYKHIEENIQSIDKLLVSQVKSGICFENQDLDFNCNDLNERANRTVTDFIQQLPQLREILYLDVVAAYNGDPASKSLGEVIFCYPGIRAISSYRIAHALLKLGVPIIPRVITELAHSETGIDIHPGATIGNSFMIDHGTGVVIGETAVIGNNVRMYQGVTLGAKSFPLDDEGNPIKGIDRHPKIGDNVIIYSNSTILGNIKVGNNAIIGGNLWVDSDVPEGAILSQKKRNEKLQDKNKNQKNDLF